ncbi:MAG TPA: hypothetical protein VM846_04010 [Vicinamibacterales bacterium]|nr:hypothetical protein [Vicinamibacterales bacterium]
MSIKRFWKWYYIVPAALVLVPLAIALFVIVGGGLVMLLWNWLLPPLFDLPKLTLLQAFGLLALCRILFGSWGGGGGGGGFEKRMSEKDRERFRERMRDRFCETPPAGDIVVPGETAKPAQ